MATSTFEIASVLEPAKDQLRVQLRDVRVVKIRPILSSDLDELRTFFTGLPRATLRFRFHSSINELSEHLLRAFTMVNDRAHVALVAEINDSSANQATRLIA